MAIDIIKDPVTGNQYSRDASITGSTYKPYTTPTQTQVVSSSGAARTNTTSNLSALQKAEASLTPVNTNQSVSDQLNEAKNKLLGMQSGINTGTLTFKPTGNSAMDASLKNASDVMNKTGDTTGAAKVMSADERVKLAISNARNAQDSEDYLGLKTAIDELKTAQTKRQTAINDLITQQAPLREQYIKSLVPGAEEKNLQVQLSDLRANIDQTTLNAQAGINKVTQQAIPQGFVTGQAKAVADAANLTLQTQAAQEKNLLTRLGFAQESRQAESAGLEAGLTFLGQDIQTQMQVQQRLDTQQQNLVTQYDKYTAQQKTDAADILDSLAGIDPSTLSNDTLAQLAKIAQQRGISLQDILAGLQLQHDQLTLENAIKTAKEQPSISDKYGTGSIGEYNFAVDKGYKGTFTQYQNEDANRKAAIAKAGVLGLTTQQYTAVNQLTTRFQADPIINQSIKGGTASLIADQIIANPESATSQLKSLYILVKNLDPDSAVREGELALANQTQSYLQTFANSLTRITEGRVISPDAAVELAKATKELMGAWNETAKKRQQQYNSQADTLGIGNEFKSYIKGSGLDYNASQPSQPQGQTKITDEEAYQEYLKMIK